MRPRFDELVSAFRSVKLPEEEELTCSFLFPAK